MSKIMMSILVLMFSGYIFAQEKAAETTYNYVGVKTCGMCHKSAKQGEQLKVWEGSKHSQAYETLKSEAAAKIAQEKGIEGPAYEAGECLKCHVTEYGIDDARLESKYVKNMGVQCESCHGPGSEYKKMSIMKDREKAIENGMSALAVSDGSAEKLCVTCHNEESPTFKGFKFDEMWPKIAHPLPSE
jgi:hypothetical protein